jgi:hypothetical protein
MIENNGEQSFVECCHKFRLLLTIDRTQKTSVLTSQRALSSPVAEVPWLLLPCLSSLT